MKMSPTNKWNVVFLIDNVPPKKIAIFKRSLDKDFAPNMYTGVGGKIEKGETIIQSAYRELDEETGIKDVKLYEFARVNIHNKALWLYYFWGLYNKKNLPKSSDGILEWVSKEKILEKDIVPTTLALCREWEKRDFSTNSCFTVIEEEINWNDSKKIRITKVLEVKEGLID